MAVPAYRLAFPASVARRLAIANAAWNSDDAPVNDYVRPYWERLCKLSFDYVRADLQETVGIALRFTLSIPGVATVIVGMKNPSAGWTTPACWNGDC